MDKSFNDARVLRSEDITLTLAELRLLQGNLESKENTVKDLRNLTELGNKIDEALGEYGERCDAAIAAARRHARENIDPESVAKIDAALNLTLAHLDDTLGAEYAGDVLLKPHLAEWARDRFEQGTKFTGNKEIRTKLLRIVDVLSNTKGVKFVGKPARAWVQGEPTPIGSGDEVAGADTHTTSEASALSAVGE